MMRTIELRRHSLRVRPNKHLSQEGVTLARRVGQGMGPFDLVVSSPLPRAFETAIAMGFAVEAWYQPVQFEEQEWRALDKLLPEGTSFEERARLMIEEPLAARYADALVQQWQEFAERLPEGGSALVTTHGGYMDDSAVACLPHANHGEWGDNFSHCEGIRLNFEAGRFVEGEILRVPRE
jgi:broad specificity phosphatase PhoE